MRLAFVGPIFAAVVALGLGVRAIAQEVHTTNLVTGAQERVLRIECLIPAPPPEVWKAFSTEAGLKKWMAPVVALDLRTGGTLSTHYDTNATIGSPGTIRLGIVHYLEGELIAFKINLNDSFSPKARAEDRNLQEIVQLVPCPGGATRVIASMVGWGTGKEWDETYNFFARGNAWTCQKLVESFTPRQK